MLGAGTFINPPILIDEIGQIGRLTGESILDRLHVDSRVSLHLPSHQQQATAENRHHLIGATGKGCSVAIVDKIRNRGSGYKLFKDWLADQSDMNGLKQAMADRFTNTQVLLHAAYDLGESILLEGTQGSLLDLHLGPYPYTTHKQTTASNWVTECGLAPGMKYETIMVARTYPIRVAGNSGPMPQETTWVNLARRINRLLLRRNLPQRVKSFALVDFEMALHEAANSGKFSLPSHLDGGVNFDFHKWTATERETYSVALSELNAKALSMLSGPVIAELMYLFELTTVTKKLRRIAEWDSTSVKLQCLYNRADHCVLTFFNYWYPEIWGQTPDTFKWLPDYKDRIKKVQDEIECRISHITTGPAGENVIECL